MDGGFDARPSDHLDAKPAVALLGSWTCLGSEVLETGSVQGSSSCHGIPRVGQLQNIKGRCSCHAYGLRCPLFRMSIEELVDVRVPALVGLTPAGSAAGGITAETTRICYGETMAKVDAPSQGGR